MTDLLSGRFGIMWDSLTSAMPQVRAGKLRAGSTPEEFGAFLRPELVKWGKLVQRVGLKPD